MSPLNKEEREKLLDKVRKLFALATSPNEAEALAAATKARELMAKYNLSQGELTEAELGDLAEIVEEIAECEFEKKFPAWVGTVAHGISLLYRTEHYVTWKRSGRETRTGNFRPIKNFKLVFVGAKDDVSAASYLMAYILRSSSSWAKEYYTNRCPSYEKQQFSRKAIYKNYFMGLARRIHQRLEEEAKRFGKMEESDPNCKALVVRKEQNLKDYMEEEHDDLKKMRVQKYNPHMDAFNSGFRDGDRVHLSGDNHKIQAPQARITHQ